MFIYSLYILLQHGIPFHVKETPKGSHNYDENLVENFFQSSFFFAKDWKLNAERKELWKSETTNC